MNKATEKQINFIKKIEEKLNIKFEGKTSRDAFLFIKKNLENYNNFDPVTKKQKELINYVTENHWDYRLEKYIKKFNGNTKQQAIEWLNDFEKYSHKIAKEIKNTPIINKINALESQRNFRNFLDNKEPDCGQPYGDYRDNINCGYEPDFDDDLDN